jgi:hypothetical protein
MEDNRLQVTNEQILEYFAALYSIVNGIPAHFVMNMDEMDHQPDADANDTSRSNSERSKLCHNVLVLNSIMEIVCIEVKVFQLIFKEQHIISNLLLIKEMLMLDTIMGVVFRKVKVLKLILKEQHIILNLLLIKELLMLNPIMGIVCIEVKVFQLILN